MYHTPHSIYNWLVSMFWDSLVAIRLYLSVQEASGLYDLVIAKFSNEITSCTL